LGVSLLSLLHGVDGDSMVCKEPSDFFQLVRNGPADLALEPSDISPNERDGELVLVTLEFKLLEYFDALLEMVDSDESPTLTSSFSG
jgi:hypothetical protein